MPRPQELFEPAFLSDQELRYILTHLGEPPIAALHGTLPEGVNRTQIQKTLGRLYELQQLQEHRNVPWAGFDAIRESIEAYLQWSARTREISRRTNGNVRHASMFVWDSSGRRYKFGIGADTSAVRTEIGPDGARKPFAVDLLNPDSNLLGADMSDVMPWVGSAPNPMSPTHQDKIETVEQGENGYLKCSVCLKQIEFDPNNTQSRSQARAQMARHLKSANREIDRHRILYAREYRQSD